MSTRALLRKSEPKPISEKMHLTLSLDRWQKLKNVYEIILFLQIRSVAPQCSTTQHTRPRLPKFRPNSKNCLHRGESNQMFPLKVLKTLCRWTSFIRSWVSSTTEQIARSMLLRPVAWWTNRRPPGTTRTSSTEKWREERSICGTPMASPTRWTLPELSSYSQKRANLTMISLTKTLFDSTTKWWRRMWWSTRWRKRRKGWSLKEKKERWPRSRERQGASRWRRAWRSAPSLAFLHSFRTSYSAWSAMWPTMSTIPMMYAKPWTIHRPRT